MRIKMLVITLLAIACATLAGSVSAQEATPPEAQAQPGQQPDRPRDLRANFLHSLGLSDEQIQQIRQINIARRPLMDEAQKRLREASRALDAAIYADQVVDADVDARIRDVQTAQAEVSRIRFLNELAIRRVLTPEQLGRFRELRQRFEQGRQQLRDRRNIDGARPLQRRGNGGGKPLDTHPDL
jgi:Spy/CpxP family protein refolding chaperone